jgi:proteasome accessory factor C
MADDAAIRARRLLALLPFLREQRLIPVATLAAAVGSDERTITSDLTVLSMCGGDERDPGQLIGVMVEDGIADVFSDLPALERPVRLTGVEARALISALETLGVDPEATLTRKLAAFASCSVDVDHIASTVRASFADGTQARTLAALNAAAEESVAVRIGYASWGAGEVTERTIHPYAIYRWRDSWYLLAYCERSGEERTFRVDRIVGLKMTHEHFDRPESLRAVPAPLPELDQLPKAKIRFSSDAPDLTDREWPGATFERHEDGSVTAEVPFAGTSWIARKVAARLGDAHVLEPKLVRDAVLQAAQELLNAL